MFYQRHFGVVQTDTGAGGGDPLQAIRALLFPPRLVRPEHPAQPLPLGSYVGTNTNDVYGTATVADQNGNPTLTLGKSPVTLHLSPWDGNIFSSTFPEWQWGPTYDGRVVFGPAPDGAVPELTTTLFLQNMFNQNATFIRAGKP